MNAPIMSFRELANIRIHCSLTRRCDLCPIQGKCVDVDLNKELSYYLEYILDKLDNAGIELEDVSSEEWVKILEGV